MSTTARITVEIDKKQARLTEDALKKLPPKFRGAQVIKAQKKLMKPVAKAATEYSKRQMNTTTFDNRTLQIVQGKYAKQKSPYVVVQHRDVAKRARRYRDKYSASTTTNWFKIRHLTEMGTDRGIRRAGTSTRQERAGRNRVKVYDKSGNPQYVKGATSGRTFLVQSKGRLHPIKTINHPGTRGIETFDRVFEQNQRRRVRNTFYEFVALEIERYKQQKGLR